MMTNQTLNWAIVGTGTIAKEFAGQFSATNARLYGVSSRREETAQAFAQEFKLEKAYSSFENLLADPAVDVVYIATPHNTHYDYMMAALEAGKHVVCEKVITINKKQLDAAYQLAKEKQVYLFEAMTIHYMPLYQNLFDWLAKKKLGPLKMVQVNFGSYKDTDPRYYYFNKELAGGALFDIGVYALHFTRWFLSSQPTEIQSMAHLHQSGVDESSVIMLKNKENELANISLTFRAKLPKQGVVAYEEGYVTITDYPRSNRAVLTRNTGEVSVFEQGKSEEGLAYEAEAISKLIISKEGNPYIDYSLDVLAIMDDVRSQWGLEYDFE